ncbi:MAG: 4-hydroxy-tetrahydrodipicolinate synthase [Proteobacteria bacterium]|nr:4-hydroxy-tetrahydrodipicolinate synthase [Pseudomonadota bacterium]
MASPLPLQGSITALVTPFRDGKVDEGAFRALVQRQIAAGTHGLVPCGTTGESATLTTAEHVRVVEICVEVTQGRVPVVAGAGANETGKAVELVRAAQAAGADAALVVTPYYNKPSQEGLFRHYAAIADGCDLPVVIYDVPGRTGVTLAVDTVARIAALPSMIGIKDATGDLGKASQMRQACGEAFVLISGDDPSALGYLAHGGRGCISVSSNVAPEACAAFQNACLAGDYGTAREWQGRLIALHGALFLDNSPAPTKFALASLGLCTEEVRLPLASCAEKARPAVLEAMRLAGVTA